MAKERKALLVHYVPGTPAEDSLDELNRHLADDWVVVSSTAMGGAATGAGPTGDEYHFVALVVLEREEKKAVRGFTGAS
ncbi:MAG TPA: hypothetical protein VK002_07490 [Rubricoccaceae bacterium]|jgi:hypothetical protein|nr:hypothetical protein [Rubricoccaceae bacterium]